MKLWFLKAKHWLLLVLLGMMGVASCGKDDKEDDIQLMYGVPEKTYNPGN